MAHIFPDLKSGSLISISQLCDHDCTAILDAKTIVKIYYQYAVFMSGAHSMETNNLGLLELNNLPPRMATVAFANSSVPTTTIGTANSLVSHDTMCERIAFYHAACFSTWPELTSARVRKHLP
jgi:hypothetical protein